MTTQQDERAELIRNLDYIWGCIQDHGAGKYQGAISKSQRENSYEMIEKIKAALLAAEEKAGVEVVAWIDKENLPIPAGQSCPVYAGPGPANFNRAALYNRPQAAAQSVPLTDQATIVGLEASVSHLSRLFDEQLSMLIQVEEELCVDGHYGKFEDGEHPLCDRIRSHIAAHGITGKE